MQNRSCHGGHGEREMKGGERGKRRGSRRAKPMGTDGKPTRFERSSASLISFPFGEAPRSDIHNEFHQARVFSNVLKWSKVQRIHVIASQQVWHARMGGI
jgi:hypothetical protein